MSAPKFLLVSLPWATYQGPSLPIGTLAAYAQNKGFDVEAKHLHLKAAALFGLEIYDHYSYHTFVGDAISAAILFPEKEKELVEYCECCVKGAKSHLIDLKHALKRIYEEVDWAKYDVVGFTTSYRQIFTSLIIAKWIKRDYPEVRIILGGRLVSGAQGHSIIKLFPQIDYCVDGEGEIALVSLLDEMRHANADFEAKVPGLIYRKEEEIYANPRQHLESLEDMPDPDYRHYYKTIDKHPSLKNSALPLYLPIEASRGCNYRCAFCSHNIFYGNNRNRPPKEVASSIQRLTDLYRISSIIFMDLTVQPEHSEKLFAHIAAQKRDYKIFCEMRANISKEVLLMMKQAGLSAVQVGIEALDTRLLKKINKGTRLIDNLQIMKFCEELGIGLDYNLILGFPTETQTDIERSIQAIEYASSFPPPLTLINFTLIDGSPVFCSPQKYGIYKNDDCSELSSRLPRHITAEMKLLYKTYKSKYKPRDYSRLNRRVERWRKLYKEARKEGCPLFYYVDFNSFLNIEDYRTGVDSITLDSWARELYLFCDSIKSFDEIKRRFPDVSDKELKRTLNKLFKLKVMFK
ncbi:MAG: RiPP maturation radical SAM C-methyltransferase [Pseudomonadota bacterium]